MSQNQSHSKKVISQIETISKGPLHNENMPINSSINSMQAYNTINNGKSTTGACCLNSSQHILIANNNDHDDDDDDDDEEQQSLPLLERLGKTIPGFGIALALLASFFLGSAGLLVKVTNSVHGIQVAVFRALFQLVVYSVILLMKQVSFWPDKGENLAVAGRALFGSISITCGYTALKLIPLGDATTIRFSLPIWTLIIGYVFLREACYMINIVAVLISIVGVSMIAKPRECMDILAWITGHEGFHDIIPQDFNVTRLEGSLIALTSSICLAISFIALRLCKKTNAPVVIFWLSLGSVLLGTVTLIILGELNLPNNWMDVIKIVLNGLCGAIGQYFITMALKIEESGPISLARTFDIVVAFAYSAVLLHEEIRGTSIIGSILVSSSVISVVLSKWFGPNLCFRQSSSNKRAEEKV